MMKPPLQKGYTMAKTRSNNPFRVLAESVGTAIVAVACVPLFIIDAVISSN